MTFLTNALNLAPTYLAYCLEVLLLVLAVRKRIYRSLMILAIYIFLLFSRETVWLYISHTSYFGANRASYFYYISDGVLTLIRLLVIVEIGIRTLRGYPAIWPFAWRVLGLIGSALILWGTTAVIRDAHSPQQLILSIREFLNTSQALILLMVLAIGLYYRVFVPQLFRSIVVGICIFSAVQIFNSELGRYVANPTNSALDDFIHRYSSAFDYIYRCSFIILEIVWLRALWIWSPAPHRPPQLITQTVYDDLSPQVHDRLRELNDRLARVSKRG